MAGLDFGWHAPLDMEIGPDPGHWVLYRDLMPGQYQYKLVIDGKWTYDPDHPTVQDGDNINNNLVVSQAVAGAVAQTTSATASW